MTWKKALMAVIGILVFYALVRMWNNGIFSVSNLQSIYTDALARRQANVDLRSKKASAKVAEINAAVAQVMVQSAKTVDGLKLAWEKKLNDTKLKAVTEKNRLTFDNETLFREVVKRDGIIEVANKTLNELTMENVKLGTQLTKGISDLNSAYEAKIRIIEEDRDFWKKQSTYWNKKYVTAKRWTVLGCAISFGGGVLAHSMVVK
jgi:hypothetical protein